MNAMDSEDSWPGIDAAITTRISIAGTVKRTSTIQLTTLSTQPPK